MDPAKASIASFLATADASELEARCAWWRKQLEAADPRLVLPLARSHRPPDAAAASRAEAELDAGALDALHEVARALGASLETTLLAAFAVLLHRHGSQDDLTLGLRPSQGASEREAPEPAGDLVLVRLDLAGNPGFEELVRRTHAAASDARAHAVPFDSLADALGWGRRAGGPRWPSAVFAFGAASRGQPVAPRDLELDVDGTPGQAAARLTHAASLLDSEAAVGLVHRYAILVRAIAADPAQPIDSLALLPDAERQAALAGYQGGEEPIPDACVHELFAAQARRTPQAPALVTGGLVTSYAELAARVDDLAGALRAHGVRESTRVALFAGRGPEAIAGALAVLTAGGAYSPIDPTLPADRILHLLRDLAPVALLAAEDHAWPCPVAEVRIPHLAGPWSSGGEAVLASGAGPRSLAYVVHTSGSTGSPKGVMVEHRSLLNHTLWLGRHYGLGPGDRFLQFIPPAFDAFAGEVFSALTHGAALVVPESRDAPTVAELVDLCRGARVTILDLPPSYWHLLADELGPNDTPALEHVRLLNSGGEACSAQKLRAIARWLPRGCEFSNAYGPTETTITATCYRLRLDATELAALEKVPIGRPITNARVYVLDAHRQPVPPTVPGELFIGGAGVARGYLDQPEQTAERFVADPFAGHGARMYRTGDLVRRLPGGDLEFLGRLDHQTKVHGQRIEPEEIESALLEHPGVRAAAVAAHGAPCERVLAAWVVLDGAAAPSTRELCDFLAQRLPPSLVPTRFERVGALPRGPSGKVDRSRLTLAAAADVAAPPPAGPSLPLELELQQIWQEVLRRPAIGVHDDFFDLGGHSLLAVRLLARVEQRLGRKLRLAALVHARTIAALARVLQEPPGRLGPSPVRLEPGGRGAPLFLVAGAGGHALGLAEVARNAELAGPVLGLELPGADGECPPLDRVESIAEALLRQVEEAQPTDPYFLGGYSFGGWVALEIARRLEARGRRVALLAMIDTPGPGFAEREPLTCGIAFWVRRLLFLEPRSSAAFFADKARGLVRRLRGRLQRARGGDAPRTAAPLDLLLEACRRAEGTYRPPAYGGDVHLLMAERPPSWRHPQDRWFGWRPLVGGRIHVHRVPGSHLTMLGGRAAAELGGALRACVATALAQVKDV